MNRRHFVKMMGLTALAPLAPALMQEKPAQRRVFLVETHIAGFYYYDGMVDRVYDQLRVGERLRLRREPGNPYDHNAIEIYTLAGNKLGYVPRAVNEIPAALLDQDLPLRAEISRVDAEMDEWNPVDFRLFLLWN